MSAFKIVNVEEVIEEEHEYILCFTCIHCGDEGSLKVRSYDYYCELIECKQCREKFYLSN